MVTVDPYQIMQCLDERRYKEGLLAISILLINNIEIASRPSVRDIDQCKIRNLIAFSMNS